ncbi:MAG TPA: hypothetical protein VGU27_06255 [Candidatus Eisenbacteria bacterium]|nr:hypothetical protein [Candidatus Eisenbacteria bacterium]
MLTPKRLVMAGMVVGSTIGSWLPTLWGAGWLSMASVLIGAAGGLAGIWVGWKLAQRL